VSDPVSKAEYKAAWNRENYERIAKRATELRKANPERARAQRTNRRARKQQAGGSHTAADILALLALQRSTCAVCRCKLTKHYHVDHIQPLAKGGTNDKLNLQILCAPCNLTKNARDPLEFMQSRGFLI
jgi:5-methylcytosine-specific restriction endonuclease McrA